MCRERRRAGARVPFGHGTLTFHENRIAVRYAYEWHDDSGNWFRSYGNENWEYDEHGLMRLCHACINDVRSRKVSASSFGRSAAALTITRR
jgi:nuclear transport factor 2 (NTF2) superfamily protein